MTLLTENGGTLVPLSIRLPAIMNANSVSSIDPIAPALRVESRILIIRDQKVLLDADLATLYGATTKRLNEQVKRNRERFPVDFMFQLSAAEKVEVVANCDHLARLKFSKSLPFAFT